MGAGGIAAVAGRRERRRQEGGLGDCKQTARGTEAETDEEEREEQRGAAPDGARRVERSS